MNESQLQETINMYEQTVEQTNEETEGGNHKVVELECVLDDLQSVTEKQKYDFEQDAQEKQKTDLEGLKEAVYCCKGGAKEER